MAWDDWRLSGLALKKRFDLLVVLRWTVEVSLAPRAHEVGAPFLRTAIANIDSAHGLQVSSAPTATLALVHGSTTSVWSSPSSSSSMIGAIFDQSPPPIPAPIFGYPILRPKKPYLMARKQDRRAS